ncbi:hypothetical protein TanjilG_00186 [Lupinus angustifolius]|uniref:DEK-C domain-containing protein n=1 Tax=Lupinus angustifolius TaxID=3871 RepID=A0A394DC98_LUPAN|nr:hypothetical protein TanjilG_00186 [Lupinus angustifolius]
MATETLEDNKSQPEPPIQGKNDDVAVPEPDKDAAEEPEAEAAPEEDEQKRDFGEITKSEEKNVVEEEQKHDSAEVTKSEEKNVEEEEQKYDSAEVTKSEEKNIGEEEPKQDSAEITKSEEKNVEEAEPKHDSAEITKSEEENLEEEKADEKREENEVENDVAVEKDEDFDAEKDEDFDAEKDDDVDVEKEAEKDDAVDAEKEVEKEEDVDAEKEDEEDDEEAEEDEDEIEEGESNSKTPKSKESEKKGGQEKDPVTPVSDRPTRERKMVERYSIPSPSKSRRSSSSKALPIEKGRGTQLKDIPNVAFKLSKRKPDDNLHTLHSILFGKKTKCTNSVTPWLFLNDVQAHNLKRNIGQFSGYVWVENEEKQRAKIKERIDKCVKEKLVDFCDVLNIPINKGNVKKEELSSKLLEFLESPHATTDVLLAEKVQKGKKRTRKVTPTKSSGEASTEASAKVSLSLYCITLFALLVGFFHFVFGGAGVMVCLHPLVSAPPLFGTLQKQKQTSQVGKKRKQLSDNEEDDKAELELSDAKDESQEDEDVAAVPNNESDDNGSKSEEEDKPKAHKRAPKKIGKEGSVAKAEERTPSVKKTSVKASKSNEKTPKKSSSKKTVSDHGSASASSKSKQIEPASKKQKSVKEKQDSKGKSASKKQTDKPSKALVKDQGKDKSSKKTKVAEPRREEMHTVVVDILKEVDFNTATLSDILRQLGTHFGLDLMHRKAEVKDIITDVINNMSDEEDEGEEAVNDGDADKDDDDGSDSDA